MRELSDWQLARVRDALRAYHCFERGSDGRSFTWIDVREAIAEYTGIEIGSSPRHGAERLRQFVEGVTDRRNPNAIQYPVPQPEAIAAIVDFVTDEDVNLLSPEELKEFIPDVQTHVRLLEYLDDGSETARLVPPENLQGVYKVSGELNSLFWVREITLQRATDKGLIQVVETENRYESGKDYSNLDEWDVRSRRKALKSREFYGGWAILTPEDNLLFFLKNEENLRNRYYVTLAADVGLWSGGPHNRLIVLQHDYPFQLFENDGEAYDLKGVINNELKMNLLFLKKAE